MENIKVLIADDESSIRLLLKDLLVSQGYRTIEAKDGKETIELAEKHNPQIVLLDLQMPKFSGIEVLKYFKENLSDIVVIVVTAFGNIETAVEAMRLGAFDYIVKSEETDRILSVLKHAIEQKQLYDVNKMLMEQVDSEHQMVIGNTPEMKSIMDMCKKIAQQDVTVLIHGESGTGKQLIAWAIHKMSPRQNKPYVHVNCATISETLIESDLFGHEKGAFTGAIKQKKGRFEIADGGTIFLDEIGELSLGTQAKLLEAIEYKSFQRLGGLEHIKSDIRIIAATNRNLENEVDTGKFRNDLYFRLNAFKIVLPPLRQRKEDIPILVDFFIKKHCAKTKKNINKISDKSMDILFKYNWPGNIRELENAIERAIVLAPGNEITPDLLDQIAKKILDDNPDAPEEMELSKALTKFKRNHINKILKLVGNNQTKAAELMKIQRTYLNKLMRELNMR